MAFFLCACDLSSNSSAPASPTTPTSVTVGRSALTVTPNSVGQVASNPEQAPLVASTATTTNTPILPLQPTPTMPPLPPTPYPFPTWRSTPGYSAITKGPSSPFPSAAFNYLNLWFRTFHLSGFSDGYDLRVYAGGEGQGGQGLSGGDPEQGVLVVLTTTTDIRWSLLGGPDVYRTPSKVGPVQIVWADYSRVLAVAANDDAFLFDVSTRRWLWPPNVSQPDDQAEQYYQARMKTLLLPYLPPPPPSLPTVLAWLTPNPTFVELPVPRPTVQEIGKMAGAGLIRGCESPAAGQPFLRRNCWHTQLIDGTDIYVGAGYGRPGYGWLIPTGLIVVPGCPGDYINGAYTTYYDGSVGLYATPRKVRPASDWVQAVGAEGERIHFVSEDGVEFVFDLPSCRWVVPAIPTPTAPPPTLPPVPPSPTELPWYSRIPPGDELNYVLKMEHLSSSVLTAVALTPTSTVPGTPLPTSTPLSTATPRYAGAGIIVDGLFPPAQSETFRYRNYWYETQSGERITMYAGVEGSKGNRVQGMIEVDVTSPDGKRELKAPVYYRTPTQSGYVQVVGADGEKLRLRTWNDTEFVFDLTSRQWLKP